MLSNLMRTHFPFNLQYTLDLIIFLIYNVGHLLQLKNIIRMCVLIKQKHSYSPCSSYWSEQWRTLHVHRSIPIINLICKNFTNKTWIAFSRASKSINTFVSIIHIHLFVTDRSHECVICLSSKLFHYVSISISIPKPLLLQLAVPLICHSESRYIYWYQFDIGWRSLPNHLHVPRFFVA